MKRINFRKGKKRRKDAEKSFFGRFWWFVWESPSVWSWVVDLILLYIIVKFIFFPVAGLIAGTSLPSVIVESESMHHAGNFEEWWQDFGPWYEQQGMSKEEITKWPYLNGIDKGDIIIVSGRIENSLKVGDVIIFNAGQAKPIIHRIIKIDNTAGTKGDNNIEQLSVEKIISEEKIIGKAIYRIPKIGWAKLFFVELVKAVKK